MNQQSIEDSTIFSNSLQFNSNYWKKTAKWQVSWWRH